MNYINEKLLQLGYKTITPIQQGVFEAINHKKHLIGLAPTGTGKTHAYLLPILANLKVDELSVQVVIIIPTNELVVQVEKMLKDVDDRFTVKTYYGGTNHMREEEWLRKNQPQIVITTPKNLLSYVLEKRMLKIHTAKYVVFDEADMMFDYDFLSQIDPILPALDQAKLMLFSATIEKSMEPFIQKYFGSSDFIDTTKAHDLDIEYALINIKHKARQEMLLETLEVINPYLCFIFVSKKENQQEIYDLLLEKNYNVMNLNASLGVKKRSKIIEDIHALKYQYVVTSDLAARGLDFKISHVINYDLPHFLEFFKHRSGRTGRMHDSGMVITYMSVDDHRKIEKLKNQGIPFVNYQLNKEGLKKVVIKKKELSDEELQAIRKIKKPKKVTPNYKKKNKQKIKKAKQEIRRKAYAKDR
jgi:ATP-dependent RNA helicase CshB